VANTPGISDFPAGIDSHTTLVPARDLASTTLDAPGVNATDTTFPAVDTTNLPAAGMFTIEGEHVIYTGKTLTSLIGCTRGRFTSLGGAAASPHSAGATINLLVAAITHEVQNDALIATQTKLGSGASTPASAKYLRGNGAGTSAWSDLQSADIAAALGYTPVEGIILQEGDATETSTATTLDFDDGFFDVSVSPAKEGNITLASGAVQDAGTLVIASGVVTLPTINPIVAVIRATVDTESAAAADDLDTITLTGSVSAGTILILTTLSSSRDVTAKNGTGNLVLTDGDFVMGTTGYRLMLVRTGSSWVELARQPVFAGVPANYFNPPGVISMYGGASSPMGWLLCDGTSYLRATYPDLFAAIGATYGAADGTHFNVPDLRDRFAIGKGVNAASDALGETGGVDAVTLTSAQSGLKAHNHGVGTLVTDNPGDHIHTVPRGTAGGSGGATYSSNVSLSVNSSPAGAHTHAISGSVANNAASDAASSHTNMPPFVTVNYIIKV
jgi:microcystin-dependent protein